MASQAAGRGGGRIGGRRRGSPPQQLNRGLTPSIGAFLTCSGKGPSANETAIWAGKIKDYAIIGAGAVQTSKRVYKVVIGL